jgi:tRNA(Glu) U13 pseudouridine synthase TruD
MEAAMDYLAETDQTYAEAKTQLLFNEILAKRVRARIFVATIEGSVEQRKAVAEGHHEVIQADEGLCQATQEFEALKARRSRAEIVIDVFRTLEASRRKT